VAAAVLVDVAEVAVALGIVLVAHGEVVILPLGVAVLPGIEIEGGLLAVLLEENRRAAPEQVVHIGLTAVGVKDGIGGLGLHGVGEIPAQGHGLGIAVLE